MGLALHRADHYALDKVLLYKGIEQKHGQGSNHDDAILDCGGDTLHFLNCVHIGDIGLHALTGKENLTQHHLQRILILLVEIDERIEISVPLSDRIIQRDDSDDRFAQRDDDADEKPAVGTAVQLCCFIQIDGDIAGEEGTGDDDVIHRDRAHQDHGPGRTKQPHVLDDQICWNQAAAEVHGEYIQEHQSLAADKIGSGEAVSGHDGGDGADDGGSDGIDNGIAIAVQNAVILQDAAIADKIDILGQQNHLTQGDGVGIGNRGDHDEIQGIEHNQQRNHQKNGGYDVKADIKGRLTSVFFLLHLLQPP